MKMTSETRDALKGLTDAAARARDAVNAEFVGCDAVIRYGRFKGRKCRIKEVTTDIRHVKTIPDYAHHVSVEIYREDGEGFLNLTSGSLWREQFMWLDNLDEVVK